jgi:two-component system chemotaxis response regulator CheB
MRDLPALLDRLITSSGRQSRPIAGTSNGRSESKRDVHALQHAPPRGELVPFTCPACGGGLWESHDGKVVRFACHVGHGYTAETLMQHQDDGIEEALWTALRALEEKAALRRRMAGQARRGQMAVVAETYEVHARESEEQAERLRAVLTDGDGRAPATESPPDARRAPAARRSGARRRVGKAAKGRSR